MSTRLSRVGSRIVIPNLQPRCRWCRLFLIVHLDDPRVVIVIRVMGRTPLVLIRYHPKVGQGLTLKVWCLYLLVPLGKVTGTSTTCPSGTGRSGQTVLIPVGPNGDWERSKETSPCPMGQVIYPRWRSILVPGQTLYLRWSLSQFHLFQLVPQSGSNICV